LTTLADLKTPPPLQNKYQNSFFDRGSTMPARVAREKGHQHSIRKPNHTPMVGEHKVKKAERLAKEAFDREQKAREEAARAVL
jgi:hypothetical protein